MKIVSFYDLAPGALATLKEHYPAHRARLEEFHARSESHVLGGCRGNDEQAVFEDRCQIFEEAIALCERDGRPLPSSTSGRDFPPRRA